MYHSHGGFDADWRISKRARYFTYHESNENSQGTGNNELAKRFYVPTLKISSEEKWLNAVMFYRTQEHMNLFLMMPLKLPFKHEIVSRDDFHRVLRSHSATRYLLTSEYTQNYM